MSWASFNITANGLFRSVLGPNITSKKKGQIEWCFAIKEEPNVKYDRAIPRYVKATEETRASNSCFFLFKYCESTHWVKYTFAETRASSL